MLFSIRMQFCLSPSSFFSKMYLFFPKPFEEMNNYFHFGIWLLYSVFFFFGIFVVLVGNLGGWVDMWKNLKCVGCSHVAQLFLWPRTHGICFWFVWVAEHCCQISLPASSRWTTGICRQPKQGHNHEGSSSEWSFLFCCTVKLLNLTNWWILGYKNIFSWVIFSLMSLSTRGQPAQSAFAHISFFADHFRASSYFRNQFA